MNLADLFVTLGVKGAGKANSDLKKTQDNIVGLSKKSLAAIGALAGVSFGLAAIYNRAMATGIGITKFSNYMGKSSDELQRWQYLAKSFKVTSAEIEGAFKNLSATSAEFNLTGTLAPELQKVSEIVGGLDLTRLDDATYMFENFRKVLKSGALPRNVLNRLVEGFVGEGVVGMLASDKPLDPSSVPRSAIMSDASGRGLTNLSASFDKFGAKLEVALSKVANEFGPGLIRALDKAIPTIVTLTAEITKLITRITEFWGGGKVKEQLGEVANPFNWYDIHKGLGIIQQEKFDDYMAQAMAAQKNPAERWDSRVMQQGGLITMVQNFFAPVDAKSAKAIEKASYTGAVNGNKAALKATSQVK